MTLAASGGFPAQLLLLLLRRKKEKAVVSSVPDSSWISAKFKGQIFSTGAGVGLRCSFAVVNETIHLLCALLAALHDMQFKIIL